MSDTKKMYMTFTCSECGSAVDVYPDQSADKVQCGVCQHEMKANFNEDHEKGIVKECPCCGRKDFYKQKDFNRKIGVILFVIAAILTPWTYGISFIVLYAFDFFLFKKLGEIVICYKCNTIFRQVANIAEIYPFNHEMNDRIIYSDHDFQGEQLEH